MKGIRKLAAALAVLLVLAATGCAEKEETSNSGKVTLEVVTMFGAGDNHEPTYKTLNQEWQTRTGNTVTDNSAQSTDRWKEYVINSFNNGTEPDVLFFFGGPTAAPIMNYVVDIDTIRSEDPDYGKNINPSYINALTGQNSNGKPVLLPMKLVAEGLFCNETLFKQENVALPTDWTSLLAAIDHFQSKKDNPIIPLSVSLGEAAYYYFDHLILAVGGESAIETNPKTVQDIPDSWVKGLNLLKELYDRKAFSPDTLTMEDAQGKNDFLSGKAAMYLDGSWLGFPEPNSGAPVTDQDVTVVPFPSYTQSENRPGTLLVGAPSGWYITKQCWENEAKRKAAIEYIRFHTSDESIVRYVKAAGGFSASATAVVSPDDMNAVQKQFALLLQEAPSTPTVIQDNLTQAANRIFLTNAAALAKGEKDARALLEELVVENNK